MSSHPSSPEAPEALARLFDACLPREADDFSRSRYAEGQRTLELIEKWFPGLLRRPGSRVLDLGSGNGGMLFPFAGSTQAIALDTYIDSDLARFKAASGLPVSQVCGSAFALPLREHSVDLVLMAEVVEHLSRPRIAIAEVVRVLRPGGVCLISTPPRLKFLTKRDPHFGIPLLVALPDWLQRRITRGRTYVHHIYATSWGIRRLFPRGSCAMHVISHRRGWTRNLSWNYIAFQKLAGAVSAVDARVSGSKAQEASMTKNMGTVDRWIRTLLALAVGVLYFTGRISGTLAIVLGAFAVVFLLTSFLSWCPLYMPFGWSTRRS